MSGEEITHHGHFAAQSLHMAFGLLRSLGYCMEIEASPLHVLMYSRPFAAKCEHVSLA